MLPQRQQDMITTPALEAIEDWLIQEALGAPHLPDMFAGMCERMRAAGITVDRALLGWVTLHPLFRAETAVWHAEGGVKHAQHRHDTEEDDAGWLQSPIRAVLQSGESRLRRRLAHANAELDYSVCHQLRDEGFTDYLLLATYFDLSASRIYAEKSGIIVTWATRAAGGFDDEAVDQIEYLQARLALACRANIQSRVAATIADTYLGHRAGQRVLSGQIRHGDGEIIDAVIFYCDLRDSTAIAEKLGPERYLRHLNAYFDATAGAVSAEGGEILDFIGDAVLAVFPTDLGGFEAATRRALCALDSVRTRICAANGYGEAPLRCGVALSAGRVMFGNIGIADRLTFSVIGQTVNAAARIEALTKTVALAATQECSALVTAEIAAVAPQAFTSAGRFVLEGFAEPVELYRPTNGQ